MCAPPAACDGGHVTHFIRARHAHHRARPLRPTAAPFRRPAARRLREPAAIVRPQREASRKLIRSCNIVRPDGEPGWPASLDEHAALLLRHHPAMRAQMAYFLAHARPGAAPASGFAPALRRFTQWLARQQAH